MNGSTGTCRPVSKFSCPAAAFAETGFGGVVSGELELDAGVGMPAVLGGNCEGPVAGGAGMLTGAELDRTPGLATSGSDPRWVAVCGI